MLCSVVKHLGSGRALKKWGKHSTASRVFPYTSFVLNRFLRALQQNRAQSRLLYLLKINEGTARHCSIYNTKIRVTVTLIHECS